MLRSQYLRGPQRPARSDQSANGEIVKGIIRRGIYHGLRRSGAVAVRRAHRLSAGRGWATILVFHTLSKQYAHDGITMAPDLFREIAHMLRDSYTVISLSDLIGRVLSRRPFTGREVVITFDDGYLDNYEFAVPTLVDLGLPACFYLTAGFINTRRQFPWDAAKGRTTRMMTWSQAREVHSLDFEIGCHTWSHADLGKEPISSASRELHDARKRIEDELGARIAHFAYPFGGLQNIRPEWVEAVRNAGFESNVRCHGGQVIAGDDPFWIAREGCNQRTTTDVRIIVDDPW